MEERWSDLAKQLMWEMNPQLNYHGTPYTFNKFDDSKFLTGEGFMAHGPGHYSADMFDVADTYNPHEGWQIYDRQEKKLFDPRKIEIRTPKNSLQSVMTPTRIVSTDDIVDWFRTYTGTGDPNSAYIQLDSIDSNELIKDMYENPNRYDVKYGPKGNTYKVNVPNENFMWQEGLPLEKQSEYIQKAVTNRDPVDYVKYLSKEPTYTAHIISKLDDDKNLQRLAKIFWERSNYANTFLNDKHLKLASKMINKLPLDEQLSFLKYLNEGTVNTVPDMRNLFGDKVKGIRARGSIDGPINVTFTGDNIKMANTPMQRFINRIPTQTLGKMASKLYNTPGVKQTIKFADRVATPLMILEGMGLSQPVGEGSDIVPQYPENNTVYGYINNY